jgi:DNA-binding transcriptional LysR family regulator
MRVTVAWSPEADADSLRIHYETATIISREIHAWAASVDAEVDEAGVVRIRAEGCVAIVELGRGVAYVKRLIADEPLPAAVTLLDEPKPPESG